MNPYGPAIAAAIVSSVLSGGIAAFAASWRQSLRSAQRDARVESALATLTADVQTVKARLGLTNGNAAAFVLVGSCADHHDALDRRLDGQDRLFTELRDELREVRRALSERR